MVWKWNDVEPMPLPGVPSREMANENDTWLDRALARKKAMYPKTGFRVVGVDSFESDPDLELYMVGDYETREEAEAVVAEKAKAAGRNGDKFYVYAAEDNK